MRALIRFSSIAAVLLAGCGETPQPDLFPPTPVIGHWTLEAPAPGEHLWIESSGKYSVSGGIARLSEGTWSYSTPWLTLDDVTGENLFTATIAGGRMTLSSSDQMHYVLDLQQP